MRSISSRLTRSRVACGAVGLLVLAACASEVEQATTRGGDEPASIEPPPAPPREITPLRVQRVAEHAARYGGAYGVTSFGAGYELVHPFRDMRVRFESDGVHLSRRDGRDEVALSVLSIGEDPAREPRLTSADNLARYEGENRDEWFRAGPDGVEQILRVAQRPRGGLRVTIAVRSDQPLDVADDGSRAVLARDGVWSATYSDPFAYDASGRALPIRIERTWSGFALVVDDANATYPVVIDPIVATQNAFGGGSGPYIPVGISGTGALFGSPTYTGIGSVASWDDSTGTWTRGSDLSEGGYQQSPGWFGYSLAVNGTLAIAGAPQNLDNSSEGMAFIYQYAAGSDGGAGAWSLLSPISLAYYDGGEFGTAVAISGSYAIGTTPNGTLSLTSNTTTGGVGVFKKGLGGNYTQQQFIRGKSSGGKFGYSLAMDGDYFVVGEHGTGLAYVYELSGTSFALAATLSATDTGGAVDAGTSDAGSAVSISDTVAISGTTIFASSATGTVYVFTRDATNGWLPAGTLTDSDGTTTFGECIGLNGSLAVIGDQNGTAYLFESSSGAWTQQLSIPQSDVSGTVAMKCAVGTNNLIVSLAPGDGTLIKSTNSYVYEYDLSGSLPDAGVADSGGTDAGRDGRPPGDGGLRDGSLPPPDGGGTRDGGLPPPDGGVKDGGLPPPSDGGLPPDGGVKDGGLPPPPDGGLPPPDGGVKDGGLPPPPDGGLPPPPDGGLPPPPDGGLPPPPDGGLPPPPDGGLPPPPDGGLPPPDAGLPPVDSGSPAVDAGSPAIDAGSPAVDAGSPAIDAGSPAVDAGSPAIDAGSPAVDAGSPAIDAGSPAVDAGSPAIDAGSPAVDAGSPATDAGSPATDAGSPAIDAGSPAIDAGSPATDAGSPATDAGSPATDAGSPATDAGSPATDAGSPAIDAGSPAIDAGSPAIDAGSPATDAGSPATDAGSPATDAGSPATDAGSPATDSGSPPDDSGSSSLDSGSPPPPSDDAGSPPPSGSDGGAVTTSDSGAPPTPSIDAAPSSDETGTGATADTGGCGCRVIARADTPPAGHWMLVAVGALFVRRRRRVRR